MTLLTLFEPVRGITQEEPQQMSWECRRKNYYYYRNHHYYGRGKEALLASLEDQERRLTLTKTRQERQEWDELTTLAANSHTLTTALADSTLVVRGYYKHHRGNWRRRKRPRE